MRIFAAVGFTVVAWASAFVVIRGLAGVVDGGALALGRLLVGVVALAVVTAVRRDWVRPTGREWAIVALYGAAWFGVYNIALNLAERVLDAGTTAMIVNIGPLLIALGGALVFRERIGRWLAIGFAVAFLGAVVIALADGARFGDLPGMLLALTSAVTYAIGVLAQKPLVSRLPSAQVTFLGCAVVALVCLPFAPQLVEQLAAASAPSWPGVLYLGVVPTAIAFTTWGFAPKRMSPASLGVTTYVVPVLVIILALVAFGELSAPLALVGGMLCLLGVGISRRRSRARVRAGVAR